MRRISTNSTKIILLSVLVIALQLQLSFQRSSKISEDLNFHINALDGQVQDAVWCGRTRGDPGSSSNVTSTVILLTTEGNTYRSSDNMVRFENLSDTLTNMAVNLLNDKSINTGEVVKIYSHGKNDTQIVVLMGNGPVSWITYDCGATFKAITKDHLKIKQLRIHPTQSKWMLALTDNACPQTVKEQQQQSNPCYSFQKLWLSKNAGTTWDLLANYVYKFEWGYFSKDAHKISYASTNKSSTDVDDVIDERRIFWVEEIGNTQNQNRLGLVNSRHLFVSDDFMKTKMKLEENGNTFHLDNNYLFVLKLIDEETENIQMKIADPKHKTIKLRAIQLGERIRNHKFTILDTSEGESFINVNHLGQNSPMGSLYASDSTGMRFVKSLEGNIRTDQGQVDFEKLHGLWGVFMANTYDEQRRQYYERTYSGEDNSDDQQYEDEEEAQESQDNSNIQSLQQKQRKKQPSVKELATQRIQTQITFDRGAVWQRIPTPKNTRSQCTSNCFLNLHSSSNQQFNAFYSSPNAIGLVLANGNVGNYLSHSKQSVNTYLSNDGGVTFSEIKQGAYLFSIGDHGSIIVIAKDKDYDTTTELEYSLDEGSTWKSLTISENPLEIDRIMTHPSNTATSFMLLAQTLPDASTGKQFGMVITIDFQELLLEKCKLPETPDQPGSDYTSWAPHSRNNTKCLLGKTVKYARRKPDANCFNGETFERIVSVKVCECTEEDWTCDYGYSRDNNGPCVIDGTLTEEEYAGIVPTNCQEYYQQTVGYVKVAGDVCMHGVDHSGAWKRCPGNSLFNSSNSLNTLLFLAFLAIGFVMVYHFQTQIMIVIRKFTAFLDSWINGKDDDSEIINADTFGRKILLAIRKVFGSKKHQAREQRDKRDIRNRNGQDEEESETLHQGHDHSKQQEQQQQQPRQYFTDIDDYGDGDDSISRGYDYGL